VHGANKTEHRDKAREAIDSHLSQHPEHEKAMKAAMAQMEYFGKGGIPSPLGE
jgi:hypothetical protein